MDSDDNIYIQSILTKKVVLKITEIGKNVQQNLEKKIKFSIEGKCITEGFICPDTVKVTSYSCGLVKDDHIEFQVIYTCKVCNPIIGLEVQCKVKNITKAGIHAEVKDVNDIVPIIVFVARDHNLINVNKIFDNIEKDDIIIAKIIGVRFELGDPNITTIADILPPRAKKE
jgi:DNA-directed RNA polymerase subunit E'/Rpb7